MGGRANIVIISNMKDIVKHIIRITQLLQRQLLP